MRDAGRRDSAHWRHDNSTDASMRTTSVNAFLVIAFLRLPNNNSRKPSCCWDSWDRTAYDALINDHMDNNKVKVKNAFLERHKNKARLRHGGADLRYRCDLSPKVAVKRRYVFSLLQKNRQIVCKGKVTCSRKWDVMNKQNVEFFGGIEFKEIASVSKRLKLWLQKQLLARSKLISK